MPFAPVTWTNLVGPPFINAANLQRYDDALVSVLGGAAKNARDYGAVCNDTANDATAVQAAITAAAAAGGGSVLIPGRCAIGSTLTLPSNVVLVGASRRCWLRKTFNGILVDHSGSATGFGNHVNNSGIMNLSLNGGGFTGACLRTYYADNFFTSQVRFENTDDRGWDALELWDSYLSQVVFENASSATAPSLHVRNSIAASGFGFSSDNSNMLFLSQVRFEGFRGGAMWVERGGFGTNNPNGIFLDQVKVETHNLRGRPLYFDDTCMHVHLHKVEGFMGAFDAGYSTAQPFLTNNAPGLSSMRDVRCVAEEAASMASVIQSFNGGGPHVIDNIEHRGSFNPTVAVVDFQGGTGRYDIGPVHSASGATLFSGPHPHNQSVTFAASYTPSVTAARAVRRMTLTGNITVNAPTGGRLGDRLVLDFLQDGTGGRVATLNAVFKHTWAPNTTAARRNTLEVEYDGTNWVQISATTNIT